MSNRVYSDLRELRRDVQALLDARRFRITHHAREEHSELSDEDRVAVVRYGGRDAPDRDRPLSHGVYLCWARHPVHGLCRGVYCVREEPGGGLVVIITAFPEEP